MSTAPHLAEQQSPEDKSPRLIPFTPENMEAPRENPAAEKKSFVIHKDSLHILNKMSDEQAGKLFHAIAFYQTKGYLPPDLDLLTDIAIAPFISQFKRDEEKYVATVEKNRTNGQRGGRPRKETAAATPTSPPSANANENQKENPVGFSGFSENPNGPFQNPNTGFENPKKPDSDSDSDSGNGNDYSHTHLDAGAKKKLEGRAEPIPPSPPPAAKPNPVAAPPSQFHFPGSPTADDIPPLPPATIRAVRERQFQKYQSEVSEKQVLDFWNTWLPTNITGHKFYPNLGDVYRHFYNRCEQIKILTDESTNQPHQQSANRNNTGQRRNAYPSGKRGGGSPEDILATEFGGGGDDSSAGEFTDAEIIG